MEVEANLDEYDKANYEGVIYERRAWESKNPERQKIIKTLSELRVIKNEVCKRRNEVIYQYN